MIIVKVTILIVMITVLYCFFWFSWLKRNLHEVVLMNAIKDYLPKGGLVAGILIIISIIGIFASVIWALFFR